LKFPPYDANEKLRSKWTDSFAEIVIAKIILILCRTLKKLFFENQIENGGVNLQKNQESTKEQNSKCQKLKFVISSCQRKFSNIGSTWHCCQMSKADAGHVDFLIRTNFIGLYLNNGLY
jgi:hypothetical protein